MSEQSARAVLDRLIRERGVNYGALSRLIGRNPAYIQQYIKRGTPRKLDEGDRRILARFFGVNEAVLGGPDEPVSGVSPLVRDGGRAPSSPHADRGAMAVVPRLALGASAGAGSLDADERPEGAVAFDPKWLKSAGLRPAHLSILHVDGDSMVPTLNHGDDIMVDRSDDARAVRDGVYVLRFEDVLMVKRVSLSPGTRGDGPARLRMTISSDNSHYPTWRDVDPDHVTLVGRVVWVGRRLR